ncbi:hypothetical protein [Nitratireductor soli]|uniref:hypothetical protein n=1 Tax=Nitratireductor soli TaxID=1670619 RepID=UPI000B2D3833|nr:hypothetical protein [Nitratireductor soli]
MANRVGNRATGGGSEQIGRPLDEEPRSEPPVKLRKPKVPDVLRWISGVGPKREAMLNGLGIYTCVQVSAGIRPSATGLTNN